MKGCIMYVIMCVVAFYLFLLALIGVQMLVMLLPTESGIVGGCIMAVGMAFAVTFSKISESNDFGDNVGKYKDYTGEPMKFE